MNRSSIIYTGGERTIPPAWTYCRRYSCSERHPGVCFTKDAPIYARCLAAAANFEKWMASHACRCCETQELEFFILGQWPEGAWPLMAAGPPRPDTPGWSSGVPTRKIKFLRFSEVLSTIQRRLGGLLDLEEYNGARGFHSASGRHATPGVNLYLAAPGWYWILESIAFFASDARPSLSLLVCKSCLIWSQTANLPFVQ